MQGTHGVCALGALVIILYSLPNYCSQSRKRGHLKWFEELFIQISGDDDQPIQMTDFKAAVHTEHVSISYPLASKVVSLVSMLFFFVVYLLVSSVYYML